LILLAAMSFLYLTERRRRATVAPACATETQPWSRVNTREANDTDRAEAAIQRMEDARLTLTLFKSVGGGDSPFDRKAGEKAPRPERCPSAVELVM
jgi:hypothetical protein